MMSRGAWLGVLACLSGVAGVGAARAQEGPSSLPGVVRRDALYDVALAGAHVWVVGYPGLILHSSDRGRSFERQGPEARTAYLAVDFVDAQTGVVVGRGGAALWTSDGGGTWEKRPLPTAEPLFDVDLVDSDTAFAVGNFAAAVRTRDGGRTFEAMRVAPEGEDPTLNALAFLDARRGVVVGEMGLVARTPDGGDSFTRVDDGTLEAHLFGIEAAGEGFVAVGSEGTVLVSRDAGATFQRVEPPAREDLIRVATAGSRVVVVGLAGTVLWARDPAGPYQAAGDVPTWQGLAGVRIAEDGQGFAVGARATLLVTRDFGATWRRWEDR